MKKSQPKKSLPYSVREKSKLNPVYAILLIAYLVIPAFAPSFHVIDSSGPKFLALAILNLLAVLVFMTNHDYRSRTEIRNGFFFNYIGFFYTIFVIISLLSFFQAINLPESVVVFSKLLSVFTATYVLYVIFSSHRGYVWLTALTLTIFLLFDCLTVFYHVIQYVNHDLASIDNIKSLYSNKNILSSAMFIKIPAALWLMVYYEGWKKKLGYLVFILAVLALLFLSTRAFYLGLILLVTAFVLFSLSRHFLKKGKLSVYKSLWFVGLLASLIVIFTLTQKFLYPKNKDTYNTGIAERLSTIKSDQARLTIWKMSFRIIRENPLLGVGIGNWKIQVLKYESPSSADFKISLKNHNDFIEVTAETGLVGGFTYLSVFFLIIFVFTRNLWRQRSDEEMVKYLFLPAFGILAYSVDAFFNFPNDRPEIQSLFAIFVAMATAFSAPDFSLKRRSLDISLSMQNLNRSIPAFFVVIFSLLLSGISILILIMNSKSLYYQSYISAGEKSGKLSYPASFFIEGFPVIPNLSWGGAPIKTYIATYLIKENKGREAVSLLKNDYSSPYDGRKEYYLSMAYDNLGMVDSALYWSHKALALKPLNASMNLFQSIKLFQTGRKEEAIQTLQLYLSKVKTNPEAWLKAAQFNFEMGNEPNALLLLDSAAKYLPENENIKKTKRSVSNSININPYKNLYKLAIQEFDAKRFAKALTLFNDFINKKPDFSEAYEHRAVCLFVTGDYSKSLLDIEKALNKGGGNEAFLINLRGINFDKLGKHDAACNDFKNAMEKGNTDAAENYRKLCEQK